MRRTINQHHAMRRASGFSGLEIVMGMYTELNCAMRLKEDTPASVIAILQHMLDRDNPKPDPMPSHPLFSTSRWPMLLTSSSYYFACCEAQSSVWLDEITKQYCITIRINLKNYEGEIGKFIDWITPYIDAPEGDFIGYSRYEETEVPTLLYHPNRSFEPTIPPEFTV